MKTEIKAIANISKIYWNNICKIKSKVGVSEKDSIIIFIENYAYEREGAPKKYKKAAIQAIKHYYNSKCDKKEVNSIFLKLLKEFKIKDNAKLNIFYPSDNMKTVIDLIMLIRKDGYNNMNEWARDKIHDNSILCAHNEIKSIRGIGEKISSFYLRDIAYKYNMENSVSDEYSYLLHPIDRWTKRGWEAWKNHFGHNKKSPAKGLADICREYNISHGEVNAGLWFYGAKVCDSEIDFRKSLTNYDRIIDNMKKYIDSLKEICNTYEDEIVKFIP